MSLAGPGAIAIWNDITPAGRANFYDWHGRQHIPERVGIPGFLGGRRYMAPEGFQQSLTLPEYFTLYETTGYAVLAGPDYAARLNAPTEWTLKSTADFSNVARALCRVEGSAGIGSGGLIATWAYNLADDTIGRRIALSIPDLAARPGVAGAHFLVTDLDASQVDNAERKRRGTPNSVPALILLIEGWGDADAFSALCGEIGAELFDDVTPTPGFGIYRLQSSLTLASLTLAELPPAG